MKRRRESLEVVVIGGGLAGAASAWGLARAGARVTLVEAEPRPGVHASGRNAGMIRRLAGDPAISALAREGARLLADPPEDLRAAADGAELVRATGSVLLAGPDAAEALRGDAEAARGEGVEVHEVAPERVPGLGYELLGVEPAAGQVAFVTPADGVADPHAVLQALLGAARAHGATIRLGRPARLSVDSGRVSGVQLEGGERLEADVVVDAAGAWAEDLVAAAGGSPPRLVNYRRHLFYTGPLAEAPAGPWVWDVSRGFYVRPESSGLLLCACDEDARPAEDAQVDEAVSEHLAEKVAALAPGWSEHPLARSWAGLRSFAPDRRFVIGWDGQLSGLFWVTALGGHGLTVSCALADLVARGVSGDAGSLPAPFDPARCEAVTL